MHRHTCRGWLFFSFLLGTVIHQKRLCSTLRPLHPPIHAWDSAPRCPGWPLAGSSSRCPTPPGWFQGSSVPFPFAIALLLPWSPSVHEARGNKGNLTAWRSPFRGTPRDMVVWVLPETRLSRLALVGIGCSIGAVLLGQFA